MKRLALRVTDDSNKESTKRTPVDVHGTALHFAFAQLCGVDSFELPNVSQKCDPHRLSFWLAASSVGPADKSVFPARSVALSDPSVESRNVGKGQSGKCTKQRRKLGRKKEAQRRSQSTTAGGSRFRSARHQ